MRRTVLARAVLFVLAACWAPTAIAEDAQAVFKAGYALHEKGDLHGAKKAYEHALELDPTLGRAKVNLGIVEIRLGHAQKGKALCEAVETEAKAPLAKSQYCLGLATLKLGPQKDAAKYFEKSIELLNDDPAPKIELAHLRRKAGRHAEAIELYRDAVRKSADTADLHVHLGYCYKHLKKWDAAEVEYRKAVQKDDTSYFGHLNLGVVLAHNKKDAEARTHYERASELRPKAAAPYYNLGNLHYRARHFAQAEDAYQKAVELEPNEAQNHLSLARIQWELAKRPAAEKSLAEADRLAKDDATKKAIQRIRAMMKKYPVPPKRVETIDLKGAKKSDSKAARNPKR